MERGPRPHGYLWVKGVPDVTTATEMTTTGELAGRERATPGQPAPGAGRAVLNTVAYVMRQLAAALGIIVLVWLLALGYAIANEALTDAIRKVPGKPWMRRHVLPKASVYWTRSTETSGTGGSSIRPYGVISRHSRSILGTAARTNTSAKPT